MDKLLPLLKSAILRQQVAAFILAAGALFKFTFDFDVSATVEAVMLGAAALIPVLTFFTRIFKPAPNLSVTANKKEVELVQLGKIPPSPTGPPTKQGGFVRAAMLGLLLALSIPAMSLVQGCTGTQHAFQQAQTLDEKAFTLLQLYAGAQSEAARLIVQPATPQSVVLKLQALAPPALAASNTLRPAAQAYKATKSAADEATLSRAYSDAILAINAFVAAVNQAKG